MFSKIKSFFAKNQKKDIDEKIYEESVILEASPYGSNYYDNFTRQGFRPISHYGNPVAQDRDFVAMRHDKMQKQCLNWWKGSTVGRRIIEIRKNLLVSEGFDFKARGSQKRKNKRLEAFFKKFWTDGKWHLELDRRIQDLLIFGELFIYCPKPNPINGKMKLSFMAPENIAEVVMNTSNYEDPKLIISKYNLDITTSDGSGNKSVDNKNIFEIIREDDDTGEISGDIFFLALNRTSGATRGISDIIHIVDLLDMYETILRTEGDRVEFARSFVYKCKVNGGDITVQSVAEKHKRPPAAGSVLIHSDKEDWAILQPQLNTYDTTSFLHAILLNMLGGMGIPEHWYVEASGIGKGSAIDLDAPIFMWARKAKNMLCQFFSLMFSYLIQESRKNGGPLSDFSDEDCLFEIISKEPDRSAYDQIGKTLKDLGDSLNLMVASNWIVNDDAGRITRNVIQNFNLGTMQEPANGPNFNVEEIKAKAHEQWYKNLQKMEGKAEIIGRLFHREILNELGGQTNTDEEDVNAAMLFLRNAFDKQIKDAKFEMATNTYPEDASGNNSIPGGGSDTKGSSKNSNGKSAPMANNTKQ